MPRRAPREGLGRVSPARVKAKTVRPCQTSDLRDDVSGGTKSVEPELTAVAGHQQRAPADQSGA